MREWSPHMVIVVTGVIAVGACRPPEAPPRIVEVRGMPPAETAVAAALWVPTAGADAIGQRWCAWLEDTLAATTQRMIAFSDTVVEVATRQAMESCDDRVNGCVMARAAAQDATTWPEAQELAAKRWRTYLGGVVDSLERALVREFTALDPVPGRFSATGVYRHRAPSDSTHQLVIVAHIGGATVLARTSLWADTTLLPFEEPYFRAPTTAICQDSVIIRALDRGVSNNTTPTR